MAIPLNLIEEAKLIEDTEENLDIVLLGAIKRGLSSGKLRKILKVLDRDLLIRSKAEQSMKGGK